MVNLHLLRHSYGETKAYVPGGLFLPPVDLSACGLLG